MKNRQIDLLDRMTQKRARKTTFSYFPHSDVTRESYPPKTLQTFWPNYRLSIVVRLIAQRLNVTFFLEPARKRFVDTWKCVVFKAVCCGPPLTLFLFGAW